MVTKTQIKEFYSQSQYAMIGVSRDKKKFGFAAFNELKKRGYNLFPVNSNTDTIDGATCYRSVETLPSGVTAAVVMTPKKATLDVVQQLIQKGIKQIWIQQNSDTPEALEFARNNGANLIHGKCILMFSEPVAGFHKFHRTLLKLFGGLPR